MPRHHPKAIRRYTYRVAVPLSKSNRYLRDPQEFDRAVNRSVASSSAVEGIHAPFADTRVVKPRRGASKTSRASVKTLRR